MLEPLNGYLQLAARQHQALQSQDPAALQATCSSAYNFGPALSANQPVSALVEQILKHWPGHWADQSDPKAPHEAGRLNLAWDKAFHQLGWQPHWDFADTVARTILWYRQANAGSADAQSLTQADLQAFTGRDVANV